MNRLPTPWKLSPSDLTFLWDECPRCFYLKVVHGFNRPAPAFPKIFSRIDRLMKEYFQDRSTAEIAPVLPAGIVRFSERWVVSQPIYLPQRRSTCYLRGKFDSVVEFTDGSYGLVDFKTVEPNPSHVPFYSRQLHAYLYALENPAERSLGLAPISRLGLLCVEPVGMQVFGASIAYLGNATWLEIPRDLDGFLAFIDHVLAILENPQPPPSGETCEYCRYLKDGRSIL